MKSQTIAQQTNPEQKEQRQHDIRGILASLYYLSKEAETAGLPEISRIIRQALQRTENCIARDGDDVHTLLADEGAYVILEFLNTFIQAEPQTRKDFLEIISCICPKERPNRFER